MIFRIIMVLIVVSAFIGVGFPCCAEKSLPDPDHQVADEIGISAEPVAPEVPQIMKDLGQSVLQTDTITGTGNLSKQVEMNDSAGGYAHGLLEVVGTDETHWEYQMIWSNKTNLCYVEALISVENAERVLFTGWANTSNGQMSYFSTGQREEYLADAPPYSGTVQFLAGAFGDYSGASMVTSKEQGTVQNEIWGLHKTNYSSSEAEIPSSGMDSVLNGTITSPGTLLYDQYARSEYAIVNGNVSFSQASAISGPNQAWSLLNIEIGRCKVFNVYNDAADRLVKQQFKGKEALDAVWADQVDSLHYSGYSGFGLGNATAYGRAEGTAGRLNYELISKSNWNVLPNIAGHTWGTAEAGTRKTDLTGSGSIPASFSGWGQAELVNGVCKNTENLVMHGAYVERHSDGGTYPVSHTFIPEPGVQSNITAGRSGTPPGASVLQGMAVLTVDADSDPTTLNGRWIVSSPAGLPTGRWIRAAMPGQQATSNSLTVSGQRDIKEMGYYRSGLVDVQ